MHYEYASAFAYLCTLLDISCMHHCLTSLCCVYQVECIATPVEAVQPQIDESILKSIPRVKFDTPFKPVQQSSETYFQSITAMPVSWWQCLCSLSLSLSISLSLSLSLPSLSLSLPLSLPPCVSVSCVQMHPPLRLSQMRLTTAVAFFQAYKDFSFEELRLQSPRQKRWVMQWSDCEKVGMANVFSFSA